MSADTVELRDGHFVRVVLSTSERYRVMAPATTKPSSPQSSGQNGFLSLLPGNIADADNDLRICDNGDSCQDDCNCHYEQA